MSGTTVLSIVQILTTVGLGFIGYWFTKQQVAIARAKLRLDHFEKRFAVSEAARSYLGKATTQGAATFADDNEFLLGTKGATFLFKDQNVKIYLDELRKRMIELSVGQKTVERTEHPLQEQARKKYLADREWIQEQYDKIEGVFRPHLQLND